MFDDLRFGISWLRLEIEGEREGGEWGRTTTATAANENLGDVKLEISGGGGAGKWPLDNTPLIGYRRQTILNLQGLVYSVFESFEDNAAQE